jgi:aerobic-type carbon monoxide dehydrogenase small subunit (CoxS/CutS family)
MKVAIEVNGTSTEHDVEPRQLLVHYLREVLGLTGTNVGCDTSSCGACTVHLDGESVKSCTVLTVMVDGRSVTTIEGLVHPSGEMHPMQRAFHENHGLQCGFCTPGMVMAATSLLRENPAPTELEVREGLEGNLCRCTGYHNIVAAVLAAASEGGGA